MDLWTEITQNAWQISIMLVVLIIPVLIGMFAVRVIGRSVKKTARVLKKNKR